MITHAYLIVSLAMSSELSSEVVRAARLTSEKHSAEQERDRALGEAKASLLEVEELKSKLEDQVVYLTGELESRGRFTEMIGESDALRYVLKKVEQVALADTTVLIEGETGVGKELVARAIHSNSLRKSKPMISINMSALPASLVEAELFGHERGAFTGAARMRKGRFELADGGTLFMDEVAEMPPAVQAKLLRVLQNGEFERIGGERSIRVDVRIIAATNRSLKDLVEKGDFREDLFHRLHVYPITVPALRQRPEDIPLLVAHFVRQFASSCDKVIEGVPQPVMEELKAYAWPGNVREMQNVIERAVLITPGTQLRLAAHLGGSESTRSGSNGRADDTGHRGTLEQVERDYILQVLGSCGWRVNGEKGAASVLGLHPNTLRSRMSKLKIERPTRGSNGPAHSLDHDIS
jgi:transcriptional regulator with GAF, ATPase, and Fis domain